MGLEVRSFRKGEETLWLKIVNKDYENELGYEQITHYEAEKCREEAEDILMAEVDGEVVGTIWFRLSGWFKDGSRKGGEIQDLAVLPGYPRSTIGKKLAETAIQKLKLLGVGEVIAMGPRRYGKIFTELSFRPVRKNLYFLWNISGSLPSRPFNRDVTIRPLPVERAEVAARLYVDAYKDYWGWAFGDDLEAVFEAGIGYFERGITTGRLEILLAYWGDKPVGMVCPSIDLKWIEAHGLKRGRLEAGVGVLPEYRRNYVGTTLLIRGLARLKERGMEQAYVTTFSYMDRNTPAFELYTRADGKI